MPLPSDEQILKTSQGLVAQLQSIFGKHPGFRPGCPSFMSPHLSPDKQTQHTAHARGLMLNPSP